MEHLLAEAPAEAWTDDLVDFTPPGKRPRTLTAAPFSLIPENQVDTAVPRVSPDVLQEWGLPRGVKITFDPSDEELLWHLLAKVGSGQVEPHPLISEFISSVDDDDRFGYTHPQRLDGVKQDGSTSYFFHRRFKVFSPGNGKHQKMQNANFGDVSWHKIGKTKPVLIDGSHQGCKKTMVLYVIMKEGDKPEKTNWMMHQYHLGSGEDGEGEFVASKIFFQKKSKQSDRNAQNRISLDTSSQDATIHSSGEEIGSHAENGEFGKCDSCCKEDSPGWDTELLDSQQHVEGIILSKDPFHTQSSCADEAERSVSCVSDNGLIGARTLVKDLEECQTVETCYRYSNGFTVDYSAEFYTDEIFKSKEEIIKWTRETGRMNGFAIVIKKSELGGSGRKPRLTFWCDRGGKYRDHRRITSPGTDNDSEGTEASLGTAGRKKCGCPFSLMGKKLATEDDWMLVVGCGVHNHPADEQLMGNPYAGRLTPEESSLLVDMFNNSARPKDILTTLKQRDPQNGITIKTIYNARQKYRRAGKIIDARTTYESKLAEKEYIQI